MALNLEVLGMLSPIFVFILVFVILYAALRKIKFFDDKAGINALIAFSMSFLFILFPFLKEVIKEAVPWLVIVFFCIVIIMVILMFMGYTQTSIVEWMEKNAFGTVIAVVVITVFLGVLSKVFSSPEAQAEWGGLIPIKEVILTPKILGAVIILIIAAKVMHAVGFKE